MIFPYLNPQVHNLNSFSLGISTLAINLQPLSTMMFPPDMIKGVPRFKSMRFFQLAYLMCSSDSQDILLMAKIFKGIHRCSTLISLVSLERRWRNSSSSIPKEPKKILSPFLIFWKALSILHMTFSILNKI